MVKTIPKRYFIYSPWFKLGLYKLNTSATLFVGFNAGF